ncbi:oligosaccharide flippase family protein [Pantoea agglomerans]|uniref:oligosaccharide flippase family protein n=1 Tax=Enterobacter agglomerans TaxID=549 RepID=UPI0013BA1CA3|nr:oligosaccharide flippase family protein [Pantoea agglomerans]NEG84753.1 oligosaccharide flippase family protein [Pantoea agglomerans]NEH06894.1 oligosaccharide flippase family protein [Pantoea agglomerans]
MSTSFIKKIKLILKSKVLSNTFSVSLVKFFDMFIPLLLIPFLTDKLGINMYGVFATCLVTLNFLINFADFGINVNASRKIAIHQNEDIALKILNVSLHAKILLLIPALLAFNIISYTYGKTYLYSSSLLSLILVCEALTPFCYFQGLQKLKTYAVVCLIWRWISASLILLLVNSGEDILIYCLLHSLSYLGIAINLYALMPKKLNFLSKVELSSIKEVLREGWNIYASTFIIGLYIPAITNFVAVTNGASAVAIFNVTQRIFSSAYRFFEPINTAIFPYLSRLYTKDEVDFFSKSKRFFSFFLYGSLGLYLLLFLLREKVVHLFIGGGDNNENTLLVYSICGLSLIANVMNLYITHVLIIIGKARLLFRIFLLGLISLLLGLLITYEMELNILYTAVVVNIPVYLSFLLGCWIFVTKTQRDFQ